MSGRQDSQFPSGTSVSFPAVPRERDNEQGLSRETLLLCADVLDETWQHRRKAESYERSIGPTPPEPARVYDRALEEVREELLRG